MVPPRAAERFQHFPLRGLQGAGEHVARRIEAAGEAALDHDADRVPARPAAALHAAHAVGDHRRAARREAEGGDPQQRGAAVLLLGARTLLHGYRQRVAGGGVDRPVRVA